MRTRRWMTLAAGTLFLGAAQPQQCPTNSDVLMARVQLDKAIVAGQDCTETADILTLDSTTNRLLTTFRDFSIQGAEKRKACNIRVPVEVLEGYKLIVVAHELAGGATLGTGSSARVQGRVVLGGSEVAVESTLQGPMDDSFSISAEEGKDRVEGECGKSVILGLNANLMLRGATSPASVVSLESADLELKTEKCGNEPPVVIGPAPEQPSSNDSRPDLSL